MDEIENKVAKSGIHTIDPVDFYPDKFPVNIDLKDWLFQNIILKEKDFREYIKNHNWKQYTDQITGIHCSADAIIPNWAYMLVAAQLKPYTEKIYFGSNEDVITSLIIENIHKKLNPSTFKNKLVVIKGCSNGKHISPAIYTHLTALLLPFAKSIMYGEPCSTVPVYKKPKSSLK